MDKVFKVALVSFRWCQYGGWVTFKRHLKAALESVQLPTGRRVVATAYSWESPAGHHDWVERLRPEAGPLDADAVVLCVLPTTDKDPQFHGRAAQALGLERFKEKNRLFAVIHDPTEYSIPVRAFLKLWDPNVFFIRKAVALHPQSLACTRRFHTIKHPFKRSQDIVWGKDLPFHDEGVFACTSRIDFDKGTHIILAANKILADPRKEVHFFTGGVNRLYNYHTLTPEFGSILDNPLYHGAFKDVNEEVLAEALGLVDMSSIAGDGGGTQYTFLEAMDHGVWMILNRAWERPGGELQHGVNCHMVKDAAGLAEAIERVWAGHDLYDRHSYETVLEAHNHEAVGEDVMSFILDPTQMAERKHTGFLR